MQSFNDKPSTLHISGLYQGYIVPSKLQTCGALLRLDSRLADMFRGSVSFLVVVHILPNKSSTGMTQGHSSTPHSHEPCFSAEQGVHLLERSLGRFWKSRPEEDRVGKVAYNKCQEVPPAHAVHSNGCYLPDKRVESETCHDADGHTLRASLGVKYFGRNDPRQRAACEAERDLIEPIDRDKDPSKAVLQTRARCRKLGNGGSDDDPANAVDNVANDKWPSATNSVDESYGARLCQDRENVGYALILECVTRADFQSFVDLRCIILDCRDTSHLNRCLNGGNEEESAEARLVGKKVFVAFCSLLVLMLNRLVDLVVLFLHPRIIHVTIRM